MRMTRKMKRDKRKKVNPLNELLTIINQYFPNFYNWLDNLTDNRNKLDLCQVFRHKISRFSELSYLNLFQFLHQNLHQNRDPAIYLR